MPTIEFPYWPRSHFAPYHDRVQRWASMVAHRRAGKTVACVNDLIPSAITSNKPNPRYAYIAPFYSQAKDVAWEYLKHYSAPASPTAMESELSVTFHHNNSSIRLYGADNPNSLRGIYLDGVIMDEFGDMKPSTWSSVILPTLADRHGWATFIGTSKGRNHFWKVVKRSRDNPAEWFTATLRASETHILSAFELEEQRRLMDEDEYAQEYECSFDAALRGAVYGKELRIADEEGRIAPQFVFDPSQPINAVCDLGFVDDTAFWFWQANPDGFLLGYAFHENFKPTEYYINKLLLLPNLGEVWLPHDAKAKSMQTGRSIVEQFLAAGIRPHVVPNMAIHDGIAAARMVLPHCHFSATGCEDGLEALRQYQRPWDEDISAFKEKPLHDWTSHYADAFRYFALIVRAYVPARIAPTHAPNRTDYNLATLFADREKKRGLIHRI
jgi:phage terminase large subunit